MFSLPAFKHLHCCCFSSAFEHFCLEWRENHRIHLCAAHRTALTVCDKFRLFTYQYIHERTHSNMSKNGNDINVWFDAVPTHATWMVTWCLTHLIIDTKSSIGFQLSSLVLHATHSLLIIVTIFLLFSLQNNKFQYFLFIFGS